MFKPFFIIGYSLLKAYKPAFAEISNILSIEPLLFAINSSDKIISGNSYLRHKYNFSKVFNFI